MGPAVAAPSIPSPPKSHSVPLLSAVKPRLTRQLGLFVALATPGEPKLLATALVHCEEEPPHHAHISDTVSNTLTAQPPGGVSGEQRPTASASSQRPPVAPACRALAATRAG